MRILIFLITLSYNVFATNIDNLTISDLFDRGYAIKATVSVNTGIVIPSGYKSTSAKNRCSLNMKKKLDKKRILKKGRSIISGRIEHMGRTNMGNSVIHLVSDNDHSVESIEINYNLYNFYKENTFLDTKFKHLKKASYCGYLTFSIVKDDNVIEVK